MAEKKPDNEVLIETFGRIAAALERLVRMKEMEQ
jgi:hypothetical protein